MTLSVYVCIWRWHGCIKLKITGPTHDGLPCPDWQLFQ